MWCSAFEHTLPAIAHTAAEGLGNTRLVATLPDGTKLWSGIEILAPVVPGALADGIEDQCSRPLARRGLRREVAAGLVSALHPRDSQSRLALLYLSYLCVPGAGIEPTRPLRDPGF